MSRVVLSGGMIAALVLLRSATAHAGAPGALDESPSATVAASIDSEPACDDDARGEQPTEDFARTVERHARLAEFTRHLQEERERAEFEAAIERHQRLVEFTRHLLEKRAAEREREFEERVSQFVKKLQFLKRLLESRAAEAPALSRP